MTLKDETVEGDLQEGTAVRDFAALSFNPEASKRIHHEVDVKGEPSLRPNEHTVAQSADPVYKAPQTRRQACLRCRIAHQPASQCLSLLRLSRLTVQR